MNRLARRASNGANGEALGCLFWCTIIACSHALLDNLNLPVETSGTALNQRDVSGQAHLVDMPSGIQVIQSVEDYCELLEPGNVELGVLDICMVSLQLHFGIELVRRVLCYLYPTCQRPYSISHACKTNQSLRFLDVLMSEQELSIEVAEVDRIEVYYVDFAKACEDEILE